MHEIERCMLDICMHLRGTQASIVPLISSKARSEDISAKKIYRPEEALEGKLLPRTPPTMSWGSSSCI